MESACTNSQSGATASSKRSTRMKSESVPGPVSLGGRRVWESAKQGSEWASRSGGPPRSCQARDLKQARGIAEPDTGTQQLRGQEVDKDEGVQGFREVVVAQMRHWDSDWLIEE